MARVITFGEIMMRLCPEGFKRFTQAEKFDIVYGGAEANVAVSLANFGVSTSFVTKLPPHNIGEAALIELRRYGVDISHIARGGERLGIYFLEKGASQRPSLVIYDRSGSSISQAQKNDFDWDSIFLGAQWFHFTGITPALNAEVAKICEEACRTAKSKGVKISCDLNYRKKLWTSEQASATMTPLMQYVDVCIANEEDAQNVFGITPKHTDVNAGKLVKSDYEYIAKELSKRFHFKTVAIALRTSINASDNKWAGLLYNGKNFFYSKQYDIHIVDRVGGGDSFGAGLIYSLLNGFDEQKTIEFAVSASCLKHSVEGDFNQVSVKEVESLMVGNSSGRIKR
ncbi:MAG: sugar kinase [Treponema sp.]|nr:sugar kinase [Treponema sp.]